MYDNEIAEVGNFALNPVSDITIYPNPTDENLTFSYITDESGYITFEIIDVTGKVILIKENCKVIDGTNPIHVAVGSLADGLYMVRAITKQNLTCEKFVISHK